MQYSAVLWILSCVVKGLAHTFAAQLCFNNINGQHAKLMLFDRLHNLRRHLANA